MPSPISRRVFLEQSSSAAASVAFWPQTAGGCADVHLAERRGGAAHGLARIGPHGGARRIRRHRLGPRPGQGGRPRAPRAALFAELKLRPTIVNLPMTAQVAFGPEAAYKDALPRLADDAAFVAGGGVRAHDVGALTGEPAAEGRTGAARARSPRRDRRRAASIEDPAGPRVPRTALHAFGSRMRPGGRRARCGANPGAHGGAAPAARGGAPGRRRRRRACRSSGRCPTRSRSRRRAARTSAPCSMCGTGITRAARWRTFWRRIPRASCTSTSRTRERWRPKRSATTCG